MEAIILSIATFFSTVFGGLFAVRFKNKLHLIMGFTAGVLLGVVSLGVKKAFFPATTSTQSSEAGKNRLSLLPYKIIGNYEIAKPEG